MLSDYPGVFIGAFRQEGLLAIAIYVLSCFFLTLYFRPQKWILALLGVSVCLFCALAFVQLTGANPFMLYPEGHNYYGANVYYSGEFIGTIGNAGLGGAFLSIVAGVLAMALVKSDCREIWFLAIPFYLTVLLILQMNIDAAVLTLGGGLLLMLPVAVTNRKELIRALLMSAFVVLAFATSQAVVFGDGFVGFEPMGLIFFLMAVCIAATAVIVWKVNAFTKVPAKWYRVCSLAIVLLVMCISFLYVWFYGERHGRMIYEASQVMRGNWDDNFGSSRVYIWRTVLEGIYGRNLLFGTGPDTLGFWPIEPFTRFSEELDMMLVTRIDAAHNEYLHMLATLGLLSLLSYLSVLILVAVQWFRTPDNKLSTIVGTGVIFYCIQAFFGISMPITAPFFWACLAVFIYSQSQYRKVECPLSVRASQNHA